MVCQGKHGSSRNTVESIWDPNWVTHMGTILTPDFKNSLAERPGAGRSATSGRRSAGGLDRVCLVKELSGELGVKESRKPTLNRESQCHCLFEVRTQEESGSTRRL